MASHDQADTQAGGGGPVVNAIAVPNDEPDVDPDQKDGGPNVPVRGGKAAAGGKQSAEKTVKLAEKTVKLAEKTVQLAEKTVKFLPFSEALLCARSLQLKNTTEWRLWSKRSDARLENIPTNPNSVYKHEGWQGYGHWLGTGNIKVAKQACLPFAEALLYARSLKLNGQKEWAAWCTSGRHGVRPANIPTNPQRSYKHDGWQGYGHWLGN